MWVAPHRGPMLHPPATEQQLLELCQALAAGEPGPPELLSAIAAGDDPLGQAFCGLRPPGERRTMGAFYTPAPMVDAMVAWVLAQGPARVVDCGCGSGRFAVALRRAGFRGAILAVDLDPLAIAMTRAHLAVAGQQPVELRCLDFLDLRLEPVDGRTVFLGNPPYLRHHQLTAGTKARGRHIARGLDVSLSGLAGLHALFVLAAAASSRAGDAGCFVTAAEWLDVGYGSTLRALLAGPLGLRFLAALRPEASTFEDAMSTAVVFGWEVGSRGGATLDVVEGLDGLAPLERGPRTAHAVLGANPRWSRLLEGEERDASTAGTVPLGALVRVHRGVATGHNAFFVLERGEGRARGLEAWLRPCLRRAVQLRRVDGVLRAGDCTHGLLVLPAELPEHGALRAYLEHGRRLGVPERYLCAHRQPWWRLPVPGTPPPMIATYMSRRPPSFATNPDGCELLNVAHGLYPRVPMNLPQQEALVTWLNLHAAELRGHRSYHGGLRKWEPRELEAVRVPPLEALTPAP